MGFLFRLNLQCNQNIQRQHAPVVVSSFHQDELDALDLDENGYLTFDEAKFYGNKTPESKLLEFFNKADHNGNNLLKGDEFDKFRYSVKDYEESLTKKIEHNNSLLTSEFKYVPFSIYVLSESCLSIVMIAPI